MNRRSRVPLAFAALIAMLLVMGCERVDLIRDIIFPDRVEAERAAQDEARAWEEFKKKQAEEEAKRAEEAAKKAEEEAALNAEQGFGGQSDGYGSDSAPAPNDPGEPIQGVYSLTFSGYEKFPTGVFPAVNATQGKLTASTFTAYRKTSPRANWTETWRIDAKRSGTEIRGPVKFVRHYLAEMPAGGQKWTTVTWSGTLEASIADDGSLSGRVDGKMVDGKGGVHSLKWTVKGARSK